MDSCGPVRWSRQHGRAVGIQQGHLLFFIPFGGTKERQGVEIEQFPSYHGVVLPCDLPDKLLRDSPEQRIHNRSPILPPTYQEARNWHLFSKAA